MHSKTDSNRAELLAGFNVRISRIGHQFLACLLENDLTNGEVRDGVAERLRVEIMAAQDEFVERARIAGIEMLGATSRVRIESPRISRLLEATSSLAIGFCGWNGGAIAGTTVIKTVTHGMLWWKFTSLVTLASTLAGLGISPILLPVTAAAVPAAVGWKITKGLTRRHHQRQLRAAFDSQLETLRNELEQWAAGVLGPEPER